MKLATVCSRPSSGFQPSSFSASDESRALRLGAPGGSGPKRGSPSPLTFKHLKKHFYTKSQSNARFLDTAEGNAAFLDTAEGDARFLGTVKTIIVNDSISAGNKRTDALCPAGYVAVGGGYNFASASPSATVTWDEPLVNGDNLSAASAGENPAPNGWGVRVVNNSGTNTYSVGVICIT